MIKKWISAIFIPLSFYCSDNQQPELNKSIGKASKIDLEIPDNSCKHKLMDVEILPNPYANDITRKIKFCYYEKKNGKLIFYRNNSNSKIIEIDDVNSVHW